MNKDNFFIIKITDPDHHFDEDESTENDQPEKESEEDTSETEEQHHISIRPVPPHYPGSNKR